MRALGGSCIVTLPGLCLKRRRFCAAWDQCIRDVTDRFAAHLVWKEEKGWKADVIISGIVPVHMIARGMANAVPVWRITAITMKVFQAAFFPKKQRPLMTGASRHWPETMASFKWVWTF